MDAEERERMCICVPGGVKKIRRGTRLSASCPTMVRHDSA